VFGVPLSSLEKPIYGYQEPQRFATRLSLWGAILFQNYRMSAAQITAFQSGKCDYLTDNFVIPLRYFLNWSSLGLQ
jgi:hypothetical protein